MVEIFHTIFCFRPHEDAMEMYKTDKKCGYYLETSIEKTWEQTYHKTWIEQTEFFLSLSKTSSLDALEHIVAIYKASKALTDMNPLYIKYVDVLLERNRK